MGDSSIVQGSGHAIPTLFQKARRSIPALVCAGLPLWGMAVPAIAQNTNSVLANYDPPPGFNKTVELHPAVGGSPMSINLGNWGGAEAHFAAASGEFLTLSAMVAGRGADSQLQTQSSFNWTTEVLGSTLGAPVVVTLTFKIDGSNMAGFTAGFGTGPIALPSDFTLTGRATSSLRFEVYDLDSSTYESGSPIARVDFLSAVQAQSAHNPGTGSGDAYSYTNISREVNLHTQDPISGNLDLIRDYVPQSFANYSPVTYQDQVDTGFFSVSFNTQVGNHINLQGSLLADLYCSGYSSGGNSPSCSGLSDFSNTFDAEISADLAGITFSNYKSGVFAAAVPEPATWAMMLAGLGGVLVRVRRRRTATP